ncbi:Uncharacterised protein [Vibrio cholerae]|uniref:Uncharacterized protein n=1 Tax=Vibrio cholerae TaxID=666 RepID=A0A655X8E4_VIBCL|nr:Uncharacterised protein [Vibrio cholerae]
MISHITPSISCSDFLKFEMALVSEVSLTNTLPHTLSLISSLVITVLAFSHSNFNIAASRPPKLMILSVVNTSRLSVSKMTWLPSK